MDGKEIYCLLVFWPKDDLLGLKKNLTCPTTGWIHTQDF